MNPQCFRFRNDVCENFQNTSTGKMSIDYSFARGTSLEAEEIWNWMQTLGLVLNSHLTRGLFIWMSKPIYPKRNGIEISLEAAKICVRKFPTIRMFDWRPTVMVSSQTYEEKIPSTTFDTWTCDYS